MPYGEEELAPAGGLDLTTPDNLIPEWLREEDEALAELLLASKPSAVEGEDAALTAYIDQWLRVLSAQQARIQALQEREAAEVKLIQEHYSAQIVREAASAESIEYMLKGTVAQLRFTGKTKSVKLPHGQVGYRSRVPVHVVVDEDRAIRFLLAERPAAVKATIFTMASEAAGMLHVAADTLPTVAGVKLAISKTDLNAALDDGELGEVPGVERSSGVAVPEYYVKPRGSTP